jgi:aminoglycoside phosphotransferase (APT) family kinase protein
MAAADPDREGLERLAERYVPGRGPVHIDRLGSGLVNRSYRVTRDGKRFSLRLAAPRAAELGLDRAWECRVLRLAAGAGLAAPVEHCEPEAGILVARWVEGTCWSAGEAGSSEAIDRVASLVRRMHALPALPQPRCVSPAEWIAFYRTALGHRRREIDREADSLLAAAAREPAPGSALCHSDLHVGNLIIPAGEPVILDWEYAHMADPWWDLAGWASNGDLAAERRDLLLARYLARAPAPGETARLGRLAWLYDYVCLLWSELYSRSRGGGAVASRAALLRQRLGDEAGDRGGDGA